MKSFSLQAIEYTPNQNISNKTAPMSYADRMMKEAIEAPAREAFNSMKAVYDWKKEANQKRAVR